MQMREIVTMVGRKRFIALVALLGICGASGGLWHQVLKPQYDRLLMEQNTVQGERVRLQEEIRGLPAKYENLKANEKRYDELVAMGFMKQQDRIDARRHMDLLRLETGVRGVTYDISPQTKIEHPESYALNMEIVKSDVKVKFKGLSDIEMRNFLDRIQTSFGGLIVVDKILFERREAVTAESLLRLSQKTPVDFVEGEATLKWYNLVPKETAAATPESQAFGGGAQ